jgi:CBS domain-containing protein
VLIERRALWGTPRDPLPVVEGEAMERVIAALARRALATSPPTGFDAEAVIERDGTRHDVLDIRRAAVMPIVELGRWAGAAAGVFEGSTVDRLRAGGEAGVLSEGDARTLSDAFEVALELRLAHHIEKLAAGGQPDDLLAPSTMSDLTRGHLRDVFRSVAAVQRTLQG